jgi:hypothetical protein
VVERACLRTLSDVLAGVAGHSTIALVPAAIRGARVAFGMGFAPAAAMGVSRDGEFLKARIRPPGKGDADCQNEANRQQPELRKNPHVIDIDSPERVEG